MMNDWGMGWGGGMFFGWLVMIALVVLSIFAIVALVRWMSDQRDTASGRLVSAREILDERFAKGEIDREDYEARRKSLGT